MVQAGVFNPTNPSVWRVSKLNLAKRKHEKMVITKQSQQPKLAKQFAQFLLSDSVQHQLHQLGFAPINEEQMQ